MELPVDLWNLIAYDLKFELDLYKHVVLVNKRLYHIIKLLYDRIPNELYIETGHYNPTMINTYEVIMTEYIPLYSYQSLLNLTIVNHPITIHKNELLKKDSRIFEIILGLFHFQVKLSLRPNIFFDNNFNQICDMIRFLPFYPNVHIYYCVYK